MSYCMIDLETLGTCPGSIFFSIGAAFFSPKTGAIGATYYGLINPENAANHGLVSDPATLKWWDKQSPEARAEIDKAFAEGEGLATGLDKFTEFLKHGSRNNGGLKDLKPISNGGDFDIPLLTVGYKTVNQKIPWNFWNIRCFRTLKNLVPNCEPSQTKTTHNALEDAIHQAKWCHNIMKGLGKV